MDQPRVPAGSPEGGQFASKNGRYSVTPIVPPQGHTQPSDSEVRAVVDYQDNSNRMNNGLRRDTFPEGYDKLDRAISANQLEHKTLYRVIEKKFIPNISSGSILSDKAFLSTTSDKEMAHLMKDDGSVVLVIKCPPGKRALDMNRVQAVAGIENPYEDLKEILLGRNTQLKITNVTEKEVECNLL
jgi:hypothetical protein